MGNFTVEDMLTMQRALQKKYRDKWEPICPEAGKHKLLWMIGEIGEVVDIIKKNGGAYLEEAKLFDVYQGAQIEAGYKSVAYSITFRSAEKTLADADIADAMDKILKGLADELGAQLRDK